MVNRRRGEIEGIIDGKAHRLVLTLGALAELESAFALDNLSALGERFASGRLSARDVIAILGAGLRAGGASWTDADVAHLSFAGGPEGAVRLAVALLEASFGAEEAKDTPRPL